MELEPDLQRLLERQREIQRAMRRPGGIRITVERELQRIREQLKNFPGCTENAASVPCAPASSSVTARDRGT
jgi:hypothetical protein